VAKADPYHAKTIWTPTAQAVAAAAEVNAAAVTVTTDLITAYEIILGLSVRRANRARASGKIASGVFCVSAVYLTRSLSPHAERGAYWWMCPQILPLSAHFSGLCYFSPVL
jgi:hypothetical protein